MPVSGIIAPWVDTRAALLLNIRIAGAGLDVKCNGLATGGACCVPGGRHAGTGDQIPTRGSVESVTREAAYKPAIRSKAPSILTFLPCCCPRRSSRRGQLWQYRLDMERDVIPVTSRSANDGTRHSLITDSALDIHRADQVEEENLRRACRIALLEAVQPESTDEILRRIERRSSYTFAAHVDALAAVAGELRMMRESGEACLQERGSTCFWELQRNEDSD